MGNPKTLTIVKDTTENYQNPVTELVSFSSVSQLRITNKGASEVSFELDNSGDTGAVEAGKSIEFNCYAGVYDENITFSFSNPSEIQIDWTEGDAGAAASAFDAKYTGYVIDLDNPSDGNFNGLPETISDYEIGLRTSFFTNENGLSYDIENVDELANVLNLQQSYFYFVKVSDTLLGVTSGKLPVGEFGLLKFSDGSAFIEYDTSTLSYVTATELYSNQDLILQEIRKQNQYAKSNNNNSQAFRYSKIGFQVAGFTLLSPNPYLNEAIVVNTSSSILYVKYGSDVSSTDFTVALGTGESFSIDKTCVITAIWESGVLDGDVLITEVI